MNSSSDTPLYTDVIFDVVNGVSVLVCLLAAILVFALKLHKIVVYRLALYQVLAALVYATVKLLQVIMVDYRNKPDIYDRVCIAIGWLSIYSSWMKLLFTMWVTFHLFCFAVLHKNLKKLEVLYVVTSLLVPAVIASVPLITHSYGYSLVDGCYLPAYFNGTYLIDAVIETVALWDGPAIVILLASSIAMVVMVIKLAHSVCWRLKYEAITDDDQYWNALKQLLPLAAFPILFFIFILPVSVYDVYYSFITPTPNNGLVITACVFIALWTIASGVTLIVHISVVRLPVFCRKLRHKDGRHRKLNSNTFGHTYREETAEPMNSTTNFQLRYSLASID